MAARILRGSWRTGQIGRPQNKPRVVTSFITLPREPYTMGRREDLDRFYGLLGELEGGLGGRRTLGGCHGRMGWPGRGVYFFFEPGELREDGGAHRVVRVGTHGLKGGSRSTLWGRLRQHRGSLGGGRPGGGNHRGSVFRLHVGSAMLRREGLEGQYPTWGLGSSAKRAMTAHEHPIEKLVSDHIRSMPFLWLEVDDEPGPESARGHIERNAIGLISNHNKIETDRAIDPPSASWLGQWCSKKKIRDSGLWNSDHVNLSHKTEFLDIFTHLIRQQ